MGASKAVGLQLLRLELEDCPTVSQLPRELLIQSTSHTELSYQDMNVLKLKFILEFLAVCAQILKLCMKYVCFNVKFDQNAFLPRDLT